MANNLNNINNFITVSSAGEMTNVTQPAFLAYLGSSDANATGDGTNFVLGSGTALTEVYDQNSDFVTSGTFTAPVSGRYYLEVNVLTSNTGAAHTTWEARITTSNRVYISAYQNGFTNVAAGGFLGGNGSVIADMDASDTATFNIVVSGGTKTVTVFGNVTCYTFVSGALIC